MYAFVKQLQLLFFTTRSCETNVSLFSFHRVQHLQRVSHKMSENVQK